MSISNKRVQITKFSCGMRINQNNVNYTSGGKSAMDFIFLTEELFLGMLEFDSVAFCFLVLVGVSCKNVGYIEFE